ncbi:MAG: class I SAM-dependent methyltransferase [Myxococcales bacterium]|nr:class I SAM-dependent methyltransferase [Myxococcales bacterium]
MNARVDRERRFHDARFSDGIGARDQDKYYPALFAARAALDYAITQCAALGTTGLEVGCGTGQNLAELLSQHRFAAHGIDISREAVAAARKRLVEFDPAPTLDVMDANQLSYENETFDFCFGSGVLHHLSLPSALHELSRVLKPGGRILFLEPLATNPLIQAYRHLTPSARSPDETPLTRSHLRQIEETFPDVRFEYFGFSTLTCVGLMRWPNAAQAALRVASDLDRFLLRLPFVWRLAWVVLIRGQRAQP